MSTSNDNIDPTYLRTLVYYCGQQEHQDEQQRYVSRSLYSLPIVIDNHEWQIASIENKLLVLMYNIACHYW